ncbi:hypothetical protein [Oligoflexus tunisiensis]|uniref:hypothetical protein n=1 Tax=Oligoflexus tunisiensis TaxID=708132 RepID=UPI00114D3182|nr:hypothetical protein [Oligoflexus tunisiensis]
MQAQLFVSGTLLFFASVSTSFAGAPVSPDPATRPPFSVSEGREQWILEFNGTTARKIFEHLRDPEVRRFDSDFFELKIGFGVICVADNVQQNHICWERLSKDAEAFGNFPYSDQLKKSSMLKINLKGLSLAQVYNSMSEDGDMDEAMDGSLLYIKQRTGLSCTRIDSPDGTSSYICSQFLSASGYPIGEGSDPMIGSGTHPVTVDAEEGGL